MYNNLNLWFLFYYLLMLVVVFFFLINQLAWDSKGLAVVVTYFIQYSYLIYN
jgi:hypothetical protein